MKQLLNLLFYFGHIIDVFLYSYISFYIATYIISKEVVFFFLSFSFSLTYSCFSDDDDDGLPFQLKSTTFSSHFS